MPRLTTIIAAAGLTLLAGCTATPFDTASDDLTTGSITAAIVVDDEDDHIWLDDCPDCEVDENFIGDLPDA